MATWRVARSLDILLGQLNARAPRRNKASDGSIGDTDHQNRTSDHNPWYGPGIVTARDFTHDPAGGLDCHWLADQLKTHRDPRIKYVIWDRRIWTGSAWQAYRGSNPHTSHLHLSVVASSLCDDTRPWNLGIEDEDVATPQEVWAHPVPVRDANPPYSVSAAEMLMHTNYAVWRVLDAMGDLTDDEANLMLAIKEISDANTVRVLEMISHLTPGNVDVTELARLLRETLGDSVAESLAARLAK